ncbi:MAG: ABC-type proline/glycine betaine transport system substrate-binding protein [Saprospiraceae bacterium]|jgi:ABC-type proline/glycine betaine transport system substrate-binding protein
MSNIDFTGPMTDAAAALVDVDSLDHASAATAFIESNADAVNAWIPSCAG